jgi:hypothetical protein
LAVGRRSSIFLKISSALLMVLAMQKRLHIYLALGWNHGTEFRQQILASPASPGAQIHSGEPERTCSPGSKLKAFGLDQSAASVPVQHKSLSLELNPGVPRETSPSLGWNLLMGMDLAVCPAMSGTLNCSVNPRSAIAIWRSNRFESLWHPFGYARALIPMHFKTKTPSALAYRRHAGGSAE